MKRIISYLILLGAAAICFASSYKEELWRKCANASQKEDNIIPANVDAQDWIKEIRKKTLYLDFYTGQGNFAYIAEIDGCGVSGSVDSAPKDKESFLSYTMPFVKSKIIPVSIDLISTRSPMRFEFLFPCGKNQIEIKTLYAENEGKENEAYVYISTLNKDYEQ